MGYFMRYLVTTDDEPELSNLTLEGLAEALRGQDPAYSVRNMHIPDLGDLYHGALLCGEIEISRPDEDIFQEEIDEFRTLASYYPDAPHTPRMLATLDKTHAMIVIEATWQGEDYEPVLSVIDPIWEWLFKRYPNGLLQAENEGFYDQDDLILEINVHL